MAFPMSHEIFTLSMKMLQISTSANSIYYVMDFSVVEVVGDLSEAVDFSVVEVGGFLWMPAS